MMRHLAVLLTLLVAFEAKAVKVEFPEEELARESVYPVFDNPTAVKRRTVETAGHVEVGVMGGWSLNDALFDPLTFGGRVGYHFNEIHGVQLMAGVFSAKPSQYVPDIEAQGIPNLANAPKPKYLLLGNYEITPYYGKLSVTKQTVMNLAIFATAGLGTININGQNSMAFSLGIGQKLYFASRWGLRADLMAITYSAPNAFSVALPADGTPATSEFKKHSFTNTMLTISGIFLL